MGDPTRLLSARSDADELERSLLESLHADDAPSDAQAEMWRGVAVHLAAASVVAAAPLAASGSAASAAGTGTAAASAGTKLTGGLAALWTKAAATKLAIVVAVGSAGAGGLVAYREQQSTTRAVERAPAMDAASAGGARATAAGVPPTPLAGQPVELDCAGHDAASCGAPAPAQRAVVEPSSRAPAAPRRSSQRDQLAAESKLLSEARGAHQRDAHSTAKRILDRLAKTYPRGVLVQEREVLLISVLRGMRKPAQARRHARAFLAAHPESPHAAALQSMLSEEP